MKARYLILMMCISASAIAGGSELGNGGFAFSRSPAAELLKFTSQELDEGLKLRSESCVNELLTQKGLRPIDLGKLRQIIRNVRKNYLDSTIRSNAEGDQEPLLFDYGTDEEGPYIEAQQIFFVSYLAADVNDARHQRDISLMLLHEASHHFDHNDDEARKFALEMRALARSMRCMGR